VLMFALVFDKPKRITANPPMCGVPPSFQLRRAGEHVSILAIVLFPHL